MNYKANNKEYEIQV